MPEAPSQMMDPSSPPAKAGAQVPSLPVVTQRWILTVTVLGSALVLIDVTAMNVIAPGIQADLDTTVAAVQWVIEAYTLMLASVMLVGGALADRFGRRKVFGYGIAAFGVASLACALAPSASTLIAARAFQGLAGAMLMPGSLALIGAHFPRAERGRAVGIWSGMAGLAAVVGPVLGGVLSDIGSWRWIFYLNVPLAALLLIPLVLFVPESRKPRTEHPLDIQGALLATLGFGALTYGLIQAGIAGWTHTTTRAGLIIGVLTIGLFLRREATAPDPMLPLRLFRDRDFAGANVLTLFVYFALAAGMFFVPMRLIFLEGYRPALAGLAMVPTIVTISFLSPRFGKLTDRVGPRPLLTLGPLVAAGGFVLLALPAPGHLYWTGTFWGLLFVGLGMSMVVAPLTTTVLVSVPDEDVGVASGANNAVSRLGALLAIAVSGLVALAVFAHWLGPELDQIELTEEERAAAWGARFDLAAANPPDVIPAHHQDAVETAYDDSFRAAYRGVQLTMGASAALGGIAGWALIQPKLKARPSEAPLPV